MRKVRAKKLEELVATTKHSLILTWRDYFLGSISMRKVRAKKLEELMATTKHSLIAESIKHVDEDDEHVMTADALRKLGQAQLTKEERIKRRRALDTLGIPSFDEFLGQKKLSLQKGSIEILQMNIGLYCNQACNHCHVESSPKRNEMMTEQVARRCMELMEKSPSIKTVDLTGGAPELNSQFRYLVREARRQGKEVIDRCNLTVLSEPGHEDLTSFLADNKVRIVASLPCYSEKNVNTQRGSGVFDKSILGLMKLNQEGYGVEGSGLHLGILEISSTVVPLI
jgi:sulfatase maturation enzyme AslB (radical SAM superfamily)